MTFQYTLSGTLDRGDGEADLEWDPPPCPDHCGGDLGSLDTPNSAGTQFTAIEDVWVCSDCGGAWDDCGYDLEGFQVDLRIFRTTGISPFNVPFRPRPHRASRGQLLSSILNFNR